MTLEGLTIICTLLSINIASVGLSVNGVDLLPILSVGRLVGLSVWKVYCGKMAERIQMPFGVVSGVGRVMGALDGGGDRRRGRDSFGGELEASHCNQWGRRHAVPKLL